MVVVALSSSLANISNIMERKKIREGGKNFSNSTATLSINESFTAETD